MSLLLNGDCLELMKDIEDKSIDLVFADLPYVDSKGKGQTSCKWNQSAIDLDLWWKEIMRIKKLNTPIFMTTTTKFGVELINSAPKKCFFRYDIVWVKSASAGFLNSKRAPLRKHEMIYVFYERLPFYDLSSHTHKFIKHKEGQIKPPTKSDNSPYGGEASRKKQLKLCVGGQAGSYDPPLPVSVVKEELAEGQTQGDKGNECYGKFSYYNNGVKGYDPPLPVSVVKELGDYEGEELCNYDVNKNTYGGGKDGRIKVPKDKKYHEAKYEPPLPNSMLEIKSTRGKHSTEKPVALMEWVLKYYSKEGDTILDPTMGSGSTGVACKNMNRKFIGIEMDKEIYNGAVERLKE